VKDTRGCNNTICPTEDEQGTARNMLSIIMYCTVVYRGSFTYFHSDDTRGCNNTICPPEDEQGTARNMLSIIMYCTVVYRGSFT